MDLSLPSAATTFLAGRGARRGGGGDGTHPSRTGWLHDWFANDPWVAWPVAVLVGILLVFVLIGRLIFKAVGDVPWWARLGLVGALFVWWRRRKHPQSGSQTQWGDPAKWVDLRDYRTPE